VRVCVKELHESVKEPYISVKEPILFNVSDKDFVSVCVCVYRVYVCVYLCQNKKLTIFLLFFLSLIHPSKHRGIGTMAKGAGAQFETLPAAVAHTFLS